MHVSLNDDRQLCMATAIGNCHDRLPDDPQGVTVGAMTGRDKIVESIVGTLLQIDPKLEQVSEATCLSGTDAVIDSVGFVNFLVSLEQRLDQRLDLSALFIDQSNANVDDAPFHRVGSLADLIFHSLESS
jgi:acyl carrier protein